MPDSTIRVHNDEATIEDSLGRLNYARACAQVAEVCDTPMVIGIFGSWGVGKTSLMRLIQEQLQNNTRVRTVWFQAWEHQFDESPALAMAQQVCSDLAEPLKQKAKKIILVIGTALGSGFLKRALGVDAKDIKALGEQYEDERFQVREDRTRLRDHFGSLVELAREELPERGRLVFFIDDLDRCMPEKVLSVLEALKIYLNLEHCVFFLGVDRRALETSIQQRYEKLGIDHVEYLDKIIQLPFTVPPIEHGNMERYVKPLLSKDFAGCLDLLVEGLGDNPRKVKRFVNTLTLNDRLARVEEIPEYDVRLLALVLLIQLSSPALHSRIAGNPDLLLELKEIGKDTREEVRELHDEHLATNQRLRNALASVRIPPGAELETYIYLTKVASVRDAGESQSTEVRVREILKRHATWVRTQQQDGERADLTGYAMPGMDLRGANLSFANMRRADLRDCNLSEADLDRADFREANLARANLSYARLIRARLDGAELIRAQLLGADMREAVLSNSNLRHTIMRDAHVRNAALDGADLRDATITQTQLESAKTDERTILPDGSRGPFIAASGRTTETEPGGD